MTNRVCLGQRATGSASGLWVSQPGNDVLTCNSAYLLFEPSSAITRVIAQGQITILTTDPVGTQYVVPLSNTNGHVPMAMYYELVQCGSGAQANYFASATNGAVNASAFTLSLTTANYEGKNWTVSYAVFSEVLS